MQNGKQIRGIYSKLAKYKTKEKNSKIPKLDSFSLYGISILELGSRLVGHNRGLYIGRLSQKLGLHPLFPLQNLKGPGDNFIYQHIFLSYYVIYTIVMFWAGCFRNQVSPYIPLSAKPQGVGGQDWNQWTDVSNYNMLFSVPTNISVNTRVSDYI